jgi:hypothetical protein
MNNFSDLLVTDRKITINLVISPISENGYPCSVIKLNDRMLFDGEVKERISFNETLGLLDPVEISIELKNKKHDQQLETAIIIDRLSIESMEIVPGFVHLSDYDNEQGQRITTNYLGFNGVWKLDINEPFYRWRHRVTGQGWLLEPIRA